MSNYDLSGPSENIQMVSYKKHGRKKNIFPIRTNIIVRGNKRIDERVYPEYVTSDMEETADYDDLYYITPNPCAYVDQKQHYVNISTGNDIISELSISKNGYEYIDKVEILALETHKHPISTSIGCACIPSDKSMEEVVFYKDFDKLYKSLNLRRFADNGKNIIPVNISKIGFKGECKMVVYLTQPLDTLDVSFRLHQQ